MDEFRIRCETCHSWLKVRGEGFLGEVHACPKCGGMVLIAAPPTEPVETRTDAPAATPPAMLGLSNTLEEAQPPVDAPAEPEAVEAEVPAEAEVEASPIEPAAAGVFSWAPIATTALCLLATGAILTVWLTSDPEPSVAVVNEGTEEATAQSERAEQSPESSAKPIETPTPEEPTEEAADPPIDGSFDQSFAGLPPESPATPPSDLPAAPREEPAVSLEAEPTLAEEQPPGEIDPLAFDPNEVELVLRRGQSEPRANDQEALSPVRDTTPEQREPTLDDQLAAAAKHAGVFVQAGPTDANSGPPTQPAEESLARVIPSIELRGIPLDKAIRLLGKLTGTPLTLDPLALQRAGVRPDRPIDLVGEETAVADLLTTSLNKSRLAFKTDGPFAIITRKGADREREVTHSLADLSGGKPDELADLLESLLPIETTLDITPAGELTLTASAGTHYDLLVLCERLRQERGLPAGSKYPRDLLPGGTATDNLASVLERRTTFSFVDPSPLTHVFDHWRRVLKRPILVDWQSLGSAGLGPQSTIECSVTNRPMSAALDGVLEPLGLSWTPAIGGSIWITTTDRVHLRRPVALSPLPAEQALRD